MERAVRSDHSVFGRGRLLGLPVRYFADKETLCLYWPLGTVVIAGPKVLDFYAEFCAHRATCLKADGRDIKLLNLILGGRFGREMKQIRTHSPEEGCVPHCQNDDTDPSPYASLAVRTRSPRGGGNRA
jgi:hypothetical protein